MKLNFCAYVQRIRARCNKLRLASAGGAPRVNFGDSIRLIPFEKSAVILYNYEADDEEIVSVYYGGQDYAAILTND